MSDYQATQPTHTSTVTWAAVPSVPKTRAAKVASIWSKVDAVVLVSLGSFITNVITTSGGLVDSRHLEAAGLGALVGLVAKLEAIFTGS